MEITRPHSSKYYRTERCVHAYLLFMILMFTLIPIRNNLFYYPYAISDWLINYQGGFVRRGLIGEVFHLLYEIHPYDVRYLIIFINVTCFLCFLTFAHKVFRKHGWSMIPLLLPISCCVLPLLFYRRDFPMLLICAAVFYLTAAYVKNKSKRCLAYSIIVMSLLTLIYEPSFFVFFPISALMLWQTSKGATWHKIVRVSCYLSLPLICMLSVVVANGTDDTAEKIWRSWQELFVTFPDGKEIGKLGEGVNFMERSIVEVFIYHLDKNFGILSWPSVSSILNNIAWMMTMTGTYFLVTHVPVIDTKSHKLKPNTQKELLGSLFIFQCLVTLPMFTVLSCDHGRVVLYCIFSTFILAHLYIKNKNILYLPPPIIQLNKHIIRKMNGAGWTGLPIVYFLSVMLIPYVSTPSPTLTDNILVHMTEKFLFLCDKYLNV